MLGDKNIYGLYLVRHGLTEASVCGLVSGRLETHLTDEGIRQSKRAGAFVRQLAIDDVYCSPSVRTLETCDHMGLNKATVVDDRLAEMDFGIYEGKPTSSVPSELIVPNLVMCPELKRPQGESATEVCLRVKPFLDEVLIRMPCVVCAVTHGTTIRILLTILFPSQRSTIARMDIENASIWKLTTDGYAKVFSASV